MKRTNESRTSLADAAGARLCQPSESAANPQPHGTAVAGPLGAGQPELPSIEHGNSLPGPAERDAYLREAAGRLSAALLHIVHQPTAKSRDRSLAAFIALIYGPTPFGGVNTLREVAVRYGMSEQNLFLLIRTHRELLKKHEAPEYEI
jgi:hypothetical protein